MKEGVFAKRERGASALPEDWDKRSLSKPTAVSAFAMIGDKELYGVSEEASVWYARMRLVLFSEGFGGIERELQKLRKVLEGAPA